MSAVERWPVETTDEQHNPQTAVESDEVMQPHVVLAPPVTSRFLFINVSAMRAKQLRRGAKPRVETTETRQKAERLAMEEIRRGLIAWQVLPA